MQLMEASAKEATAGPHGLNVAPHVFNLDCAIGVTLN